MALTLLLIYALPQYKQQYKMIPYLLAVTALPPILIRKGITLSEVLWYIALFISALLLWKLIVALIFSGF